MSEMEAMNFHCCSFRKKFKKIVFSKIVDVDIFLAPKMYLIGSSPKQKSLMK